jgi:hypothetical protein
MARVRYNLAMTRRFYEHNFRFLEIFELPITIASVNVPQRAMPYHRPRWRYHISTLMLSEVSER